MAKRFTDTNKWRKGFIRGLDASHKLLWLYILDECDHAGVWHVEIDIAQLRIGEEFDEKNAKEVFKDHIVSFDNNEKWFIPDFIEFQYGKLNPENRAHSSVIGILNHYNLEGAYKGLTSPKEGAKDKDKDKDKDKKGSVRGKEEELSSQIDFYESQKKLSGGDENYENAVNFLFGKNLLARPLYKVLGIKYQLKYESFKIVHHRTREHGLLLSDIFLKIEEWDKTEERENFALVIKTFIDTKIRK